MDFTIKQPKKKGIKPGLLLVLTDSIHFLNNSLEKFVKKKLFIFFKTKGFFYCDYWDNFEKFKEGLSSKIKFYNSLTNRAISDKN